MTTTTNSTAVQIAEIFATGNPEDVFSYSVHDNFSEGYWDAWQNWDNETLKTYVSWEGEKPASPIAEFVREWVLQELSEVPEKHLDLINEFGNA